MSLGKFIWRWSWLLTLPIVCVFLLLSWNTLQRYYTFEVHHQIAANARVFSIWQVGKMEFSHLLRKAEVGLAMAKHRSTNHALRTIDLFIPESGLAHLNSNLPNSGFNYIEGGFWYDGRVHKVKLRYRGDTNYHWAYYKKSLRVKTKKDRLFEGMRVFNLIAPRTPELLNNYLSFNMGRQMGLVSPNTELVKVNINGEYTGVYILTEQLSESTLRSHNLMPGDLYSGELIAKDSYSHLNYFKGPTNTLFTNAELWDKKAINNHYPEQSRIPLQKLIDIIKMPQSEQRHAALSDILDMQAFGQFHALELLTASIHVDEVHNWRLYYDPWRSKFVPIVWDLVGWQRLMALPDSEVTRLDNITSSLHFALHSNGDFIRARQRAIEKYFADKNDQLFLNNLDQTINNVSQAIRYDPNLVGSVKTLSPQAVEQAMAKLRSTIVRVFSDLKQAYITKSSPVVYQYQHENGLLSLSVTGRRTVQRLRVEYSDLPNALVSAELRFWQNNQMQSLNLNSLISQKGNQIELNLPLLANYIPRFFSNRSAEATVNSLQLSSAYYEIRFSNIAPENQIVGLSIDYGDNVFEPAVTREKINRTAFNNFYRAIAEQKPPEPIVWENDIEISGVTQIDSPLIIRPGTTVRFTAGASLILRNRLIAVGSAEQPIRFIPSNEESPWGSLVLAGQQANGSRISHVLMQGGSGLKNDLAEYTAMLSIHDVKDVVISHSLFQNNRNTDDMVHTVYSQVEFSDTVFRDSLFDSLDIDISDVLIERCEFINSGNDAIDMMTSRAFLHDTIISNSRDKGVSVGEKSYLLAINNKITHSEVAIQTKDGSVAALYNMDFIANKHALDAYKKNWRYADGGKTFVHKSRLIDNLDSISADKKSLIHVYDSYIDRSVNSKKKQIEIDDSVDSANQTIALTEQLLVGPIEQGLLDGFDADYLKLIRATKRGFSEIDRH